jgi:hypothetical protein
MTEVRPGHVAQEIAPSRTLSALLKDRSHGLVSQGAFVELYTLQKVLMGGRPRAVADDAVNTGAFAVDALLAHINPLPFRAAVSRIEFLVRARGEPG